MGHSGAKADRERTDRLHFSLLRHYFGTAAAKRGEDRRSAAAFIMPLAFPIFHQKRPWIKSKASFGSKG